MKKYLIFLLIILVAGAAPSCNDMLELQNDGRTTLDEIFSKRIGVVAYYNSCYNNRLDNASYWQWASLTDDAQDADGIYGSSLYSNRYADGFTASSFYCLDLTPWAVWYEGIHKCNVFLKRMEGVTTLTIVATEAEITSWVAQVYALRAYYYLQLIKRYGAVPLLTETYTTDHDYSGDRRAPVSEVVAQILSDCDAAMSAPVLSEGFAWKRKTGQEGTFTRATAQAIRSQAITLAVSPFFNDGTYTWADATRINGEALSGCLANDYALFNDVPAPDVAQNAYALYFITRSDAQQAYDKETIQGGANASVWQHAGIPSTPGQINAGSCPTQELVDCYEMLSTGEPPILGYADERHLQPILNPASGYDPDNPYEGRDPRFYASIYYNGASRQLPAPTTLVETYVGAADGITATNRRTTRTGYYLRKYNNWKSGRDNSADGEVRRFRLAELYLNFAESACQSDGPDAVISLGNGISMSARDAVNAVRTRAGMPPFPTGMSKDAFEKKYRNERRVELAFEENRYFDVRRWRILEQSERYVTGMRITQTGTGFSYERIGFERASGGEKYYLYPIDATEATKMRDHTGVDWQNPGWN